MRSFPDFSNPSSFRALRWFSFISLIGATAAFGASGALMMLPSAKINPVLTTDDLDVTGLPTTYRVSQANWEYEVNTIYGDGPEEGQEFMLFILNAQGDTVAHGSPMPLVPGPNELTIKACGMVQVYWGTGPFDPDQWEYGCETKATSHWYDDPTKTYGATVSPDNANATHVTAIPSTVHTAFTISRGSATATIQSVQLTISCTGILSETCAFTAGGGTTKLLNLTSTPMTYGVSFSLSAADTGRVKLVVTAYGGGPSFTPDTGSIKVTAVSNGGGGGSGNGIIQIDMHSGNPGVSVTRSACVSIPAGRTAAVECGDLRVVQPLQSTTTMNKERTPTLTYLSRHVNGGAALAADVTIDSISATHLLLIMTIPGVDTVSYVVPWSTGWNDSVKRRVTLPFNASAKSVINGVYTYTMEVWALNNGVPVYSIGPLAGDTLVVVNRSTSPFGMGWWLSGYEQLSDSTLSATTKLWIGSDGSTRVYTRQSDTTKWIVTPALDRPDTLVKVDSSGTTLWRRQRGNGAYVQFSNAGLHVATVNELGHKTRFMHTGNRLDSVVLPVPSGSGAVPTYRFAYVAVDGSDMLDTVHAPKNPSTTHRRAKIVRSGRSVLGFTFTDGGDLTYRTISAGIIDSLSNGPKITWNTATTLVTAFVHPGLGTTAISPIEGTGITSAAIRSDSASTLINGPRTDVGDTTRILQTRYGAPRAVKVDTTTTVIERLNGTFPMLVTRVITPGGFATRTTYTNRGLVDSVVAASPFGGSDSAKTKYTWHSSFNRVTQITGPTGDVVNFAYDGSGLMTYREDGRGSSTRTNYYYDTAGRVDSVQPPGHSSSQRYTFEYDSYLGNAWKTKTPLGFVTETTRDTVGRAVTIVTPIDSNPSSNVKSKRVVTYNAWNCVLTSEDKVYSGTLQPNYVFASITDTARNTDLTISHTCAGPIVTATTVDGLQHTVTQNAYGYAACAGITCTYDAAGNVTQMTTSAGSVYLKYDSYNRLVERRTTTVAQSRMLFPNEQGYTSPLSDGFNFPALGEYFPYYPTSGSTLTIPADTATFTYDVDGNLLTANNTDARIARTYFPNGALKVDSVRIRKYGTAGDFSGHKYGIKYEYDLAGRRTKMQIPTTLGHGCSDTTCFQRYHYLQHLGAVDTIKSYRGDTFVFGYDDAGRRTSQATALGSVDLTWAYDLDDRLVRRQERRNSGGTTVHLDSLWYDARGKVKKAVLAGTADSVQVAQFAYDRHGYLVAAEFRRTASGQDTTNHVFKLDPTGNVDSVEKDKSLGSTIRKATYDNDGRVIGQSEYPSSNPNLHYEMDFGLYAGATGLKSALQYSYTTPTGLGYESASWHQTDGKLRYFQRVGPDNKPESRSVWEEYRYDALGRRVLLRSRSMTNCAASYCKPSVERFIWDGDQLLFEMRVPGGNSESSVMLETDSSTVNAHYGRIGYVHGGGIDAPIALYRNGVPLVPHANWRGFYDSGTDTTGAAVTATVSWIARHKDPYMDNTLPDTAVKGWAGSLVRAGQDQSGLFYRRNRYYDPATARFTQSDPIGLSGGLSLYGYAAADPINRFDPFGLCSCVYSQSSGILSCQDDASGDDPISATGYSGDSAHKNDPDSDHLKDQGPVPRGSYTIEDAHNGGGNYTNSAGTNLGPMVLPLTASQGNDMHDRNGMAAHGESTRKPPGNASQGCIILDRWVRDWLNGRGCALTVIR